MLYEDQMELERQQEETRKQLEREAFASLLDHVMHCQDASCECGEPPDSI